MHAALIERLLGGRIIGVIARDATEIGAREEPARKDNKDDTPPPGQSPHSRIWPELTDWPSGTHKKILLINQYDHGKQVISDIGRPRPFRAENEPIFCAKNHVGMSVHAETMVRWFSDGLSVLVPSPYAYLETVSLVLARWKPRWRRFPRFFLTAR